MRLRSANRAIKFQWCAAWQQLEVPSHSSNDGFGCRATRLCIHKVRDVMQTGLLRSSHGCADDVSARLDRSGMGREPAAAAERPARGAVARTAEGLWTLHDGLRPLVRERGMVCVFNALITKSPETLHLVDSSIVHARQHSAGGRGATSVELALYRQCDPVERFFTRLKCFRAIALICARLWMRHNECTT